VVARRRVGRFSGGYTGIVIVVIAAAGVFAVFQFTETERERELNRWQQRLGVVADSRLADIEGWIGQQTGALDALAENESLQLYLSILTETDGAAAEKAEATYLRSLLTVAAKREGFEPPAAASTVRANVQQTGTAGMALLGLDRRIIVASPSIPDIEGKLAAFVAGAAKGKPAISGIFTGPAGVPTIAFLAPVFDIQGDRDPESQIGMVLGVKLIAHELYPLLKQPGSTEDTTEALLAQIAAHRSCTFRRWATARPRFSAGWRSIRRNWRRLSRSATRAVSGASATIGTPRCWSLRARSPVWPGRFCTRSMWPKPWRNRNRGCSSFSSLFS